MKHNSPDDRTVTTIIKRTQDEIIRIQWPKPKRQSMVHKTLHRQLKRNKAHPNKTIRVNSDVPEG
jgi:hypothetical protein